MRKRGPFGSMAEPLFDRRERTDPSPRRAGPSDGPTFSTGQRITVRLLRDGAMSANDYAAGVGLARGEFLRQLRQWCEGEGFTYGISVTDDGEIRSAS